MQGPSCVKRKYDHRGQAAAMQTSRPPTTKARKSRTLISLSSNRPLSDYSNDLIRKAAKRTEEWVNRPAAVRWRETAQRGGYVARPLNSFMLYRSAYITEAKARYSKPKPREFSTIVADSWHRESHEVRQAYAAYAKIERRNHHEAYPKYKFSPQRLKMKKEDTSPEEELRTISGAACSCDSCWPAAAMSNNQAWDTTLSTNTNASVCSPAPSDFAAWQPILLPMQPILLPMQPILWQDQYGNQVAGSNFPWPSAMTPSLFLGPSSATWEPPMGSMAFPRMPTTNDLPVVDSSWSGAEMPAGTGVNYAMPAHDLSCCGYLCTSSEDGALP